jgi:hypothetical protein
MSTLTLIHQLFSHFSIKFRIFALPFEEIENCTGYAVSLTRLHQPKVTTEPNKI